MKKNIILVAAAAIACLCGCAKTQTSGTNDASKQYFDAWVSTHKDASWKETGLGSWIIEDKAGSGEMVGEFHDSLFLRFNYTFSDLKGDISGSSYAAVNQQLGTYAEGDYYGPQIFYGQSLYAGLEDMLKGMKTGGRRKVAIPGWLITYDRYSAPEKYLDKEGGDPGIYEIELTDIINNINKWECDSISSYIANNFKVSGSVSELSDTTGFWYIRTAAPESEKEMCDTTVYINYIGRLLNGTVFDTNIRDTAVFHGIDSDSRDYSPISFSIKDEYSNSTMGDDETKVVKGFARAISKMHPFEQGSGIFMSELGYWYNGSGNTIPAYSPLRFDIQIVKDPTK